MSQLVGETSYSELWWSERQSCFDNISPGLSDTLGKLPFNPTETLRVNFYHFISTHAILLKVNEMKPSIIELAWKVSLLVSVIDVDNY